MTRMVLNLEFRNGLFKNVGRGFIPRRIEITSSKAPMLETVLSLIKSGIGFENWNLGIVWILDVGIWNLAAGIATPFWRLARNDSGIGGFAPKPPVYGALGA